MKTVSEYLSWGKIILQERHIDDPGLNSQILLSHAAKLSKEDLVREPERKLPSSVSKNFKKLIQKRSQEIPLVYLTGEKEFYSLKFFVNEHVLIPRPETEILIDWFGEKIGNHMVRVCDVGTGSGIIAVTLRKLFPALQMIAVDISPEALEVAKRNAATHKVMNIEFIQSNLLENTFQEFDVIVANLPYIPNFDLLSLPKTVKYEPITALDGGSDGLKIYRRLFEQMQEKLVSGGKLFLEFGIGQREDLISLLRSHLFSNIETRKDYAGIDRILYAEKK